MQECIRMENITKSFGDTIANKNVNLNINRGEIHALLGENGAGKSTLMNMLSGIYQPDSGSIYINENITKIASPQDSINLGIGMIHQHFKLVDVFDATENIILGQKLPLFYNHKKLEKELETISKKYGLVLDFNKKVYDMSISAKQTIEIVKVLYQGADILILDEPTAVLTPQEIEKLFDILKNMKESNCAVVLITHKLNEIMEISDRVTVLRKGETVGTVETKNTSIKELTDLMVGKSVDLKIDRTPFNDRGEMLKIENLTVLDSEKVKALKDVTFTLNGGEILGVAGVSGSGQKELCESIAGLINPISGSIIFNGDDITNHTPRDIIKLGISMSFIPEDRLGMGLVASMDMAENMLLKDYINQKGIFLDRAPAIEKAKRVIKKLDVQTPGVNHPIKQLSGGNIQKVLLGREIDSNPHLLITAYPVRGLDIGASYTIYDLLNAEKEKGVGVLFIGEDLDVLLELCDRIIVLCHGEITGIVDAATTTKEQLGLMMVGNPAEEVLNC